MVIANKLYRGLLALTSSKEQAPLFDAEADLQATNLPL